jgi:hypothetical protein
MEAEDKRRNDVMLDILKDRPDLLAEYQAKMAEIRATYPAK